MLSLRKRKGSYSYAEGRGLLLICSALLILWRAPGKGVEQDPLISGLLPYKIVKEIDSFRWPCYFLEGGACGGLLSFALAIDCNA